MAALIGLLFVALSINAQLYYLFKPANLFHTWTCASPNTFVRGQASDLQRRLVMAEKRVQRWIPTWLVDSLASLPSAHRPILFA